MLFMKGAFATAKFQMIVSVEFVGMDGALQRCEVANVERIVEGAGLNDFGLSLEEGKEIQRRLQRVLTQFQTDQATQRDRQCQDCNRPRKIHDYRSRTIHSLFGSCRVPPPPFLPDSGYFVADRYINAHFDNMAAMTTRLIFFCLISAVRAGLVLPAAVADQASSPDRRLTATIERIGAGDQNGKGVRIKSWTAS